MSLFRITKLEDEMRRVRATANSAYQTATAAQSAILSAGGYVPVDTYSDIALYPADQRIEGMLFFVVDTGVTYRLDADLVTVTPAAMKMWCADDSTVRELRVRKDGDLYTIEVI